MRVYLATMFLLRYVVEGFIALLCALAGLRLRWEGMAAG
jgi:hypothetical protein